MENSDQNARVERAETALRVEARRSSIVLWLGTMDEHELEQMDALAMSIIRERDTWARHEGDSKFHAVADIGGGSVSTLCRGRWHVTDDYETEARPPRADRCDHCQALFVEQQLAAIAAGCTCRSADVPCRLHVEQVETGLRELLANAPSTKFAEDVEQGRFEQIYRREIGRRLHQTTLVEFEMADEVEA